MMGVYQGYIIRRISIDMFNKMHSILDIHDWSVYCFVRTSESHRKSMIIMLVYSNAV